MHHRRTIGKKDNIGALEDMVGNACRGCQIN